MYGYQGGKRGWNELGDWEGRIYTPIAQGAYSKICGDPNRKEIQGRVDEYICIADSL